MIKKTISYIGIYTILFNVIFSFLFFLPVDAEEHNNLIPQNKQTLVSKTKDYSEDRVIVKFKNNTGTSVLPIIQSKFSNIGLTKIDIFDKFNVGILSFDEKLKDLDTVITELKKVNNVEYAEYDYVRKIDYVGVNTNDTNSIEQRYLKSIKADDAWKIYNDDENNILVSVNDTGIDYSHPDLIGNLKDLSLSCKSDTGATISGGCPNHGWNFEGEGLYNSAEAVLPENENFDINGHGTHVAGTIGAVGNNSTGVIGVTQNANIMSARIETYYKDYSIFYVSNVIRALNFAVLNGAKVINASYGGGGYSQAEYDSIKNARDYGVIFVAAAGNSNSDNDGVIPFYPSGYDLDNIISVASVGNDDNLAYYSNYGSTTVDLVAPGGDFSDVGDSGILATFPFSETIWEHNMNSFSGITLTGTGLDWALRNNNIIETNSGAYSLVGSYTGSEDKSLIFNNTIDLSGVKFAKFDGYIDCALQDGDELQILLNNQVIGDNSNFWTFSRYQDYGNVILPIPSNLYTSGLELKVNFKTNSTDNNFGCGLNDFKIISYDDSKHSYESMQGTSMATPIVVGVVSMLWSYKPELLYSEVKDIIFSSLDILPSLNSKVLTSGKINAKNAIKELISRYGITKNGYFEGETFNTPNIMLNGKELTLSGSTINITSTGSVISLTGSTITGTGVIKVGTGTSNNAFSTSSDFDVVLKNINGTNLDYSGSTVYGESLILDYTGSLTGNNLNLKLKSGENVIYDGVLTKDLIFPINSSFSGAINSYVYKNGDISYGIGSGVVLEVLNKINIGNVNFQYTPSIFTGTLAFDSGLNTGEQFTYVHLTSTHYPVNYQISGNLARSYTGTLNNSGSILVELTPGDGIKTLSGKLENLNHQFSQDFFGSINKISIPTNYDIDSYSEPSSNTGSVLFIGTSATSTGVIFNSTGTLNLISSDGKNNVILSLSGLTINSNAWDLIFNPPAQTTFSGTFSSVGYNHIEDLSYSIGNNDSELDLIGLKAQVKLFVGTDYNGKTLGVFRSINKGVNYSYLTNCLVSNGICSFETDKFSLYTIGIESDSTPNNFAFTDIINSELSTENISNTITVSGTNTGSVISIINGFYSINSGLFTNLNGIVHELDQIRVKLVSSTVNSTVVNSVLNIGGVSDTYSVTTKASSSSSGGGGSSSGGGGGRSYPVCLDSQLTCKVVSGSTTTFKWYKREGFTCVGGNLGKICDKSQIEKAEEIVIPTIIVDGKELDYIKYENIKIQQIQALLFNKLKNKKPTILTYNLVNKVIFNLNRILTDKTLSKVASKILRNETISTYKKYLVEYKKLPNAEKIK